MLKSVNDVSLCRNCVTNHNAKGINFVALKFTKLISRL